MSFLRTSVSTIGNSVYGPRFYHELASRSFSYSIKYITLLSLAFAIIYTLWFGITIGPSILTFFTNVRLTITETIPNDLVVTIKAGNASINRPEPYTIATPQSWKSEMHTTSFRFHKNLLVIDTKTPFSVDAFRTYDTFVLLGKQDIVYENNTNRIEIVSLVNTPQTTIDKNTITFLIDKVE